MMARKWDMKYENELYRYTVRGVERLWAWEEDGGGGSDSSDPALFPAWRSFWQLNLESELKIH